MDDFTSEHITFNDEILRIREQASRTLSIYTQLTRVLGGINDLDTRVSSSLAEYSRASESIITLRERLEFASLRSHRLRLGASDLGSTVDILATYPGVGSLLALQTSEITADMLNDFESSFDIVKRERTRLSPELQQIVTNTIIYDVALLCEHFYTEIHDTIVSLSAPKAPIRQIQGHLLRMQPAYAFLSSHAVGAGADITNTYKTIMNNVYTRSFHSISSMALTTSITPSRGPLGALPFIPRRESITALARRAAAAATAAVTGSVALKVMLDPSRGQVPLVQEVETCADLVTAPQQSLQAEITAVEIVRAVRLEGEAERAFVGQFFGGLGDSGDCETIVHSVVETAWKQAELTVEALVNENNDIISVAMLSVFCLRCQLDASGDTLAWLKNQQQRLDSLCASAFTQLEDACVFAANSPSTCDRCHNLPPWIEAVIGVVNILAKLAIQEATYHLSINLARFCMKLADSILPLWSHLLPDPKLSLLNALTALLAALPSSDIPLSGALGTAREALRAAAALCGLQACARVAGLPLPLLAEPLVLGLQAAGLRGLAGTATNVSTEPVECTGAVLQVWIEDVSATPDALRFLIAAKDGMEGRYNELLEPPKACI